MCTGFFRKDWLVFFKTVLNSKTNYIITLFKKEISILSYIAKKLQVHQFSQQFSHLALKEIQNLFNPFFNEF